jgi:hypothetical protein
VNHDAELAGGRSPRSRDAGFEPASASDEPGSETRVAEGTVEMRVPFARVLVQPTCRLAGPVGEDVEGEHGPESSRRIGAGRPALGVLARESIVGTIDPARAKTGVTPSGASTSHDRVSIRRSP